MSDTTTWVLRPRDDRPDKGDRDTDPWSPWYDKCFGMLVRAESEAEARQIADDNGADETGYRGGGSIWTNSDLSTCVPVSEYESDNDRDYVDDAVLMRDIHHA